MKYSTTILLGLAGIAQAQNKSTYYACSMKNAVTVDQYVASVTPKGTSGGTTGGRTNLDLQNQLNQSSAAGACLIASSVGAGTCERVTRKYKRQSVPYPVIPCPSHMACLKQEKGTPFQCFDVNSGDYVSPTGACYIAATKKYDENCLADSKEEFEKLGIKFPENASKASSSSDSSSSSSTNKSSSTSSASSQANGAAQVGATLVGALIPMVAVVANL